MARSRDFDYPAGGRVRTGTFYSKDSHVGPNSRSCVVVVHGLTASRRLPEIDRFCEILASRFDVVAIDMRGHGDSTDRFTWGREEHQDLAELVRFLRPLHPAIGVVGFSIGGFIAIASAALVAQGMESGRPDAICTVSAPAHLEFWRYRFGLRGSVDHMSMLFRRRRRGLRPGWPGLRWARADRLATRVSPVPLLVVHGDRDWLVHPGQGRAIYEAARDPRELVMIPDGLHAEYIVAQDPELLARPSIAFFERTLGGVPSERSAPEISLTRDRS